MIQPWDPSQDQVGTTHSKGDEESTVVQVAEVAKSQ